MKPREPPKLVPAKQFLRSKLDPKSGSQFGPKNWFPIWNHKLVPILAPKLGSHFDTQKLSPTSKTGSREPVAAVPAISGLGISGCAVWGFFGSENWQIWATRGRRKECARWALREALGAPLPERAPTVCGARGGRGLILSARTLQLILWRAAFVETLALCVCVCVYERGLQPTSPRPFDKMRCDYSRSTHHCVAVAT